MKRGSKLGEGFVAEFEDALEKRAKSIRHQGAVVERVVIREIVDGKELDSERAEHRISYRIRGSKIQIRVQVWNDRWLWIDMRCSSKMGWVWEHTVEGRFVSNNSTPDVIRLIEKTIEVSRTSSTDMTEDLQAIWEKSLATGPRKV